MEKETTVMEPELLQLRQMVLENTKRISRCSTSPWKLRRISPRRKWNVSFAEWKSSEISFPNIANKEIVAAVAAINYEDGADQLAHEEGLLVIRVSSDDVFSLDPFDVNTLRRF